VTTPTLEQTPAGWGPGAERYAAEFAPFTGAFAADAVELLDIGPNDTVLDVAAGSGAFAVRAAARGAAVLAVDFAAGMLDALRPRIPADLAGSVRTAVMDGQALDVEDRRFSVAASMFGVIFFPDAAAGLRELARVTQSGGRMAVASWSDDGPRLSRLVGDAIRAAVPDIALPTARSRSDLGTPAGCAATLIEQGWHDVEVHVVTHDLVVPDPPAFFRSLSQWSAPVVPLVAGLDAASMDRAADAFTAVVRRHGPEPDRVPFSALVSIGVPA
jgi:ubiquinone/menaquinone biosynthesis C-methylase UbiE